MLRSLTTHLNNAPQLRKPVERHAYSTPVVREIPAAIRLDVFTPGW